MGGLDWAAGHGAQLDPDWAARRRAHPVLADRRARPRAVLSAAGRDAAIGADRQRCVAVPADPAVPVRADLRRAAGHDHADGSAAQMDRRDRLGGVRADLRADPVLDRDGSAPASTRQHIWIPTTMLTLYTLAAALIDGAAAACSVDGSAPPLPQLWTGAHLHRLVPHELDLPRLRRPLRARVRRIGGGMYINLILAEMLTIGGFFLVDALSRPAVSAAPDLLGDLQRRLRDPVLSPARSLWIGMSYLTGGVYADEDDPQYIARGRHVCAPMAVSDPGEITAKKRGIMRLCSVLYFV